MQINSETETHNHQFASIADAKTFALAGNATITLESLKSGIHFTFKIKEAAAKSNIPFEDSPIHFVTLLCDGSADDGTFRYLGIVRNGAFILTRASKATESAPSVKAIKYFFGLKGDEIPAQLVIRHEMKCGRCGRTLTVPSSIDRGIGPDCAELMGLDL